MKNIDKKAIISSIEAYSIFEAELPSIAKKHKLHLLNITSNTLNIREFVKKYDTFLGNKLTGKKYDIYKKKLLENKGKYIKTDGKTFNDIHITPEGYNKFINVEAMMEITVNYYVAETLSVKNKMLSASLDNELYNAIESIENSYLLKSLSRYIGLMEFEKGNDRNFTIKKNGEMTYTPSNKDTILTEDRNWDPKCRQEIKYGKAIRKIFAPAYKITEKEVEYISNKLSERYKFTAEFRVVEGTDITKYYHGETYARNAGSLNNSCMRSENCQDFFKIYEDSAKMLIAIKDDKIVGRAILWEKAFIEDEDTEIKVMDRIYGNDITIEAFKSWASNNHYHHKLRQSYTDPTTFIDPVTKSEVDLDVYVEATGNHEMYPYMDTFKECDDINTAKIKLHNNRSCTHTLTETGGYMNDEDYVTIDGERVHIDDTRYVERYEEHYLENECVYVDSADEWERQEDCVTVGDDWYHEDSDDIVYSQYAEEYIRKEEGIYIESTDTWYPEDADCIKYSEHTGQSEHEDNVVWSESLQDYIPLDEAVECHMSNEWILKDNAIEVMKNGITYYAEFEKYTEEELVTKLVESLS
jgi:hypothetical protein